MLPRIAIVGYGQMGKQIESLAKDKGFEVAEIFDTNKPLKDGYFDFDVAIDFTYPDTVFENVKILASKGKNIVLGTTGWYNKKSELENIVNESNIGLVWGSNFSVGVQTFFRIVQQAARLIDKLDDFDVMVHEMHHKRKKDSPSGTAVSISQFLLNEIRRKNKIETARIDDEIGDDVIHVSSTRGGEVFGRHTVYLDSISDSIELSHRAKSRAGFALGSLEAAKWIHEKKGFWEFTQVMEDIFND